MKTLYEHLNEAHNHTQAVSEYIFHWQYLFFFLFQQNPLCTYMNFFNVYGAFECGDVPNPIKILISYTYKGIRSQSRDVSWRKGGA